MARLRTCELTAATWRDLTEVLGERGGSQGCGCMHWRVSFSEWKDGQGDGNREALQRRARQSPPAGLVGYLDHQPVGWIALGPRDEYARMSRSPVMRPLDDTAAWVVSCVFVHSDARGQGLPVQLIEAACELAARYDQPALDAIPVEPAEGKRVGPDSVMTGLASSFRKAGFDEITRPKPDRPYFRRRLGAGS